MLLVGAILAPGKRTVSSALQVLGLQEQRDFARYHHVLSRAVWSPLAVSRVLLSLLLRHLAPATGPLVLGIDETVKRRKGKQIKAKGVYRDGVRSSHGHFVKAMGLRWVSLMWLVEIPWARRVWALPFLTVLAPSSRYHAERGRRHKTVTDWARQMLCCVRRWLPARDLVVVGDRGYAALRLLAACQRMTPALTFLTRPAPGCRPLCAAAAACAGAAGTAASQGSPSAFPAHGVDRSRHRLDLAAAAVAGRHGAAPGVCVRHGCLVSRRSTPSAHPLAAAAGPRAGPAAPGSAQHRPRPGPAPDPDSVPAALVHGSDLSGRAHLSGRGDTAAVVAPGHPAHHPGPAGPLQLAGAGHPCPAAGATRRPPSLGLVRQAAPHFLRCPGLYAPHALAPHPPFSPVAVPDRQPKTCPASTAHDYGDPLLHGVIVQSRAKRVFNKCIWSMFHASQQVQSTSICSWKHHFASQNHVKRANLIKPNYVQS